MATIIIGSSGFIGSSLLKVISGKDLFTLNNGSFRNVGNGLYCDFNSMSELSKIFETLDFIEEVYLLIGSFSNTREDLHVNVALPISMLDAIKSSRHSPRVLLVGSSAEYGQTMENIKVVSEEEKLLPISFYGLTKMFLSQVMEFYARVHGMDIVYARVFNVLGAGMNRKLLFGRVYEEIVSSFEKELTISTGSLDAELDYILIEDLCSDLITVMHRGKTGEVYNVGSGRAVNVRNLLVDFIHQHCKVDFSLNVDDSVKPKIKYSCANIDKLKAIK